MRWYFEDLWYQVVIKSSKKLQKNERFWIYLKYSKIFGLIWIQLIATIERTQGFIVALARSCKTLNIKEIPLIPSMCINELDRIDLWKLQNGFLLPRSKGNPYSFLVMIFNVFKSKHAVIKFHFISLKLTRVYLGVHYWSERLSAWDRKFSFHYFRSLQGWREDPKWHLFSDRKILQGCEVKWF